MLLMLAVTMPVFGQHTVDTMVTDSTQLGPEPMDGTAMPPKDTVMLAGFPVAVSPKVKKWFDRISIRGYVQVRYNRLLESNPDLACEQCDRSWGKGGGFSIRRARIIFFGQIHEQVYFYIQPDFASNAGNTSNITQLRDAYFDVGFDRHNRFRARIGQSKVPFGFENMQSSQNRLPLDRNDALNSAVANERDLGIFLYWAPKATRELFSALVRSGLKGSGDYGVVGLGIYNGQTANRAATDGMPHIVARISYPFQIGSQVIEPGIQGYTGHFKLLSNSDSVGLLPDRDYLDQRAAASFILYPKPFGIQAEYNVGRGPEYDRGTDSVQVKLLHGGYVTLSCLFQVRKHVIMPFARVQYYRGGKKHELDARSYEVNEYEVGIEYQPFRAVELVAMYTYSQRRMGDGLIRDNPQEGGLLRLQVQVNF